MDQPAGILTRGGIGHGSLHQGDEPGVMLPAPQWIRTPPAGPAVGDGGDTPLRTRSWQARAGGPTSEWNMAANGAESVDGVVDQAGRVGRRLAQGRVIGRPGRW